MTTEFIFSYTFFYYYDVCMDSWIHLPIHISPWYNHNYHILKICLLFFLSMWFSGLYFPIRGFHSFQLKLHGIRDNWREMTEWNSYHIRHWPSNVFIVCAQAKRYPNYSIHLKYVVKLSYSWYVFSPTEQMNKWSKCCFIHMCWIYAFYPW